MAILVETVEIMHASSRNSCCAPEICAHLPQPLDVDDDDEEFQWGTETNIFIVTFVPASKSKSKITSDVIIPRPMAPVLPGSHGG